jgi:sporulation protein YlmC with PRC-barrel domain
MVYPQILNLPVRTESGQKLGRVVDVDVDPDTQQVMSYHIKVSRLVPDLVASPLLVRHSQVISISANELVVDDAVLGEGAVSPQPSA